MLSPRWASRQKPGWISTHETNTYQANAFQPNWGPTIFQSASEIAQNTLLRERLNEILATAPAEKEWWEQRKSEIQSDFMRELDEEKSPEVSASKPVRTGSDDDAVIVEGGGPAAAAGKSKKKGKGKQ